MERTIRFRWIRLKRKPVRWVTLAALLAAWLPGAARAQRLIAWPMARPPATLLPPRPLPPPSQPPAQPAPALVPPAEVLTAHPSARPLALPPSARVLPITRRAVEGTVSDDLAHLTVEVRFYNDGSARLEGDLYLPIPQDVVFDQLEMEVGGKTLRAQLLDAAQARSTYEGIVRQLRDPALLELVNDRLARARVFPIEPFSEVRLRYSFVAGVQKEGNLRTLKVPAAQFSDEARHDQRVLDLRLSTSKPLRLVYSPSHKIEVRRRGEREATVWYGDEAVLRKDLVLMYSIDEGPLSVSLSVHREAGEPGTFLLSLDPHAKGPATPTPKDVVFVVDRSGSMADDGKIEQLRRALTYCLEHLSRADRLALVDFGTGVQSFSESLLPASRENVEKAAAYAQALEVSGGTNIEGALQEALKMLRREPGRLPVLLFMTDGRPTVGETDTGRLLGAFSERNRAAGVRFFGFGIGPDVNTQLIDKLADAGHGSRDYALPGEDLEPKLARFFDRIARPALTDVRLAWEGGEVSEIYPRQVSDLFYGDSLVLLGRYRGTGEATLRVTGRQGPRGVSLEVPVRFPERAEANPFLPRLWAHRKVAQLMDEIRLSGGANPEIAGEIARLAKRYGIVTPYTSFLIADDKDIEQLRPQALQGLRAMAAEAAGAPEPRAGGAASALRALSFSRNVQMMISGASSGLDGGEGGFSQAKAAGVGRRGGEMRSAGEKTFYLRRGLWTDSVYELDKAAYRVEEVKSFSPAFFRLVAAHPELKEYLAQGGDLLVVLDGKAYRIAD